MDNISTQQAVEGALTLRLDILRFQERFPSLPAGQTQLPRITWAELERQLTDLSRHSGFSADQVRRVIESLRGKAASAPSELLLRELLIAVSILLEDPPEPRSGVP